MANYQTKVNSDDSITLIAKTTDGVLFGLTTEEIEKLPVSVHKNYFVAAGTVEKVGYEFRTIPFDKPRAAIKEVKDVLDNIKEFVILKREVAKADTDFKNLQFNFTRQEAQLLALKDKKQAERTTVLEQLQHKETPTEVVGNVVVNNVIATKEKLGLTKLVGKEEVHNDALDAFNVLMKENLLKLPTEIVNQSQLPLVIRSTFTTYYLISDGATKVETEYHV